MIFRTVLGHISKKCHLAAGYQVPVGPWLPIAVNTSKNNLENALNCENFSKSEIVKKIIGIYETH